MTGTEKICRELHGPNAHGPDSALACPLEPRGNGDHVFNLLRNAYNRLFLETHRGSHVMANQSRKGWRVCVACLYEEPSVGWCEKHDTLDTCWTERMPETVNS